MVRAIYNSVLIYAASLSAVRILMLPRPDNYRRQGVGSAEEEEGDPELAMLEAELQELTAQQATAASGGL